VEAALAEVDRRLEAYQAAWDAFVDSWLVVRIDDPQVRLPRCCSTAAGAVLLTALASCRRCRFHHCCHARATAVVQRCLPWSSCSQGAAASAVAHLCTRCHPAARAPLQWVFAWRLQAEHRMRDSGKTGMTDEQVADFVSRYIPAYTAYLPGLYAKGPTTAKAGRTLTIQVGASGLGPGGGGLEVPEAVHACWAGNRAEGHAS